MTPEQAKKVAYTAANDALYLGWINAGEHQQVTHMIRNTPPSDWTGDKTPYCFEPVRSLAQATSTTDRTIYTRNRALAAAGLVLDETGANGFRSAGWINHQTGERADVFGINLSPLRDRADELRALAQQRRDDLKAATIEATGIRKLLGTVRRVLRDYSDHPALSRAIKALVTAMDALPPRQRHLLGCEPLRALRAQIERALAALIECADALGITVSRMSKTSDASEDISDPYKTTNNHLPSEEGSCPVDSNAVPAGRGPVISEERYGANAPNCWGKAWSGLDRCKQNRPPAPVETQEKTVPIETALQAASGDFVEAYQLQNAAGWPGLIAAATLLRPMIGISESLWADAFDTLGRQGAALALLISDARRSRGELRPSRQHPDGNAGAYLRGMITRAKEGRLRLGASVYALAGSHAA